MSGSAKAPGSIAVKRINCVRTGFRNSSTFFIDDVDVTTVQPTFCNDEGRSSTQA